MFRSFVVRSLLESKPPCTTVVLCTRPTINNSGLYWLVGCAKSRVGNLGNAARVQLFFNTRGLTKGHRSLPMPEVILHERKTR